jgi:4-amino-4-deoxychorismate lyase
MKPLLLETIRCEHGILANLPYHQKRLERSRRLLLGEQDTTILLADIPVPEEARHGLYKCRVLYAARIEKIAFLPYARPSIQSLQIVEAGPLEYAHKYADRRGIEQLFKQRGRADDVLLSRHGLLMDTSYANIALYDGRRWFTPARPLLPGTRRAALIDAGILQPERIYISDLPDFQELRLINAMIGLEDALSVPIEHVFA